MMCEVVLYNGPAIAKVRSPSVDCRVAGTIRLADETDRRLRCASTFADKLCI